MMGADRKPRQNWPTRTIPARPNEAGRNPFGAGRDRGNGKGPTRADRHRSPQLAGHPRAYPGLHSMRRQLRMDIV